ncbi:hypothetical protein NECID01_1259 [Nematocida sp. AWRm77]|nr:hypothetical protein NECID01_1259 [Nematocida sp. AWRm77]
MAAQSISSTDSIGSAETGALQKQLINIKHLSAHKQIMRLFSALVAAALAFVGTDCAPECQSSPLEVVLDFVIEKDCLVSMTKIEAAFSHLRNIFSVSELGVSLSLGDITGISEQSLHASGSEDVASDTGTEEASLALLQKEAMRAQHHPLVSPHRAYITVFLFNDQDSGGVSGVSKENGVFTEETAVLSRVKSTDSPKVLAELAGHEIAHVLGSAHDGENNTCTRGHLMDKEYVQTPAAKLLSSCSANAIRNAVKKLQCGSKRRSGL